MEATLGAKFGDLAPEVADQYFIPRKGSKRQHSKLYDYENFGASIDSLFTFAFVRNPWDLVISEIFYFKTNKIPLFSAPDIKKNIDTLVRFRGEIWGHTFEPQSAYLKDLTGELAIDFVGDFKNLERDFFSACDRLGLARPKLRHHFNNRKDRKNYTCYYDEESRGWVASRFQEDIVTFGFQFGCTNPLRWRGCNPPPPGGEISELG
jgi:hypothetical protein